MRVARERKEPALRVLWRDLDLGSCRAMRGGASSGRVHAAQDAERLLCGLRAAVGEQLLHRPVASVHVRLPFCPAHARVSAAGSGRRVRVSVGWGAPRSSSCGSLASARAPHVLGPQAGTMLAQHKRGQLNQVQHGLRQLQLVVRVQPRRQPRCEARAGCGPRQRGLLGPELGRQQPAQHARVPMHVRQPRVQLLAGGRRGQQRDASGARRGRGLVQLVLLVRRRQRQASARRGEVACAGQLGGLGVHGLVGQRVRLAVERAPNVRKVHHTAQRLKRRDQRVRLLDKRHQRRVAQSPPREHGLHDQLRVAGGGDAQPRHRVRALREEVERELQPAVQAAELGEIVGDVVAKEVRPARQHRASAAAHQQQQRARAAHARVVACATVEVHVQPR